MLLEYIHPSTNEVVGVTNNTERKFVDWLERNGFQLKKKIVETSEELMREATNLLNSKQKL